MNTFNRKCAKRKKTTWMNSKISRLMEKKKIVMSRGADSVKLPRSKNFMGKASASLAKAAALSNTCFMLFYLLLKHYNLLTIA